MLDYTGDFERTARFQVRSETVYGRVISVTVGRNGADFHAHSQRESPCLFESEPRGTAFDRGVVQAMEIFGAGQKEGGFFVMIGRKPGETKSPSMESERVATTVS